MSFSFSFAGDDIEDEGVDSDQQQTDNTLAHGVSQVSISESTTRSLPAQRHAFQDLLAYLPSQISYNTLSIPSLSPPSHSPATDAEPTPSGPGVGTETKVLRRAHFDILTQLMAESSPTSSPPDAQRGSSGTRTDDLITSIQRGDLSSGFYEGGFKTWECALDLSSLVTPLFRNSEGRMEARDLEVVEMGCGTAIPSLGILRSWLGAADERRNRDGDRKLSLTLCDYNEDVLRLATGPNVLLNYLCATGHRSLHPDSDDAHTETQGEGELDIEDLGENFIADLARDMESRGVSVNFFSGGWGDEFLSLVASISVQDDRDADLLVLASETIYAPSTLGVFVDTLLGLLRSRSRARAWVAAKKVYFGVGGGVEEFVRVLEHKGGTCERIWEGGAGVARIVLEVRTKSG